MEQLPAPPPPVAPAATNASAPAADSRNPCCAAPAAPRPLDLSGMADPGDLRATRLEEFTIDGICGVY
jgi:hypothetical protein